MKLELKNFRGIKEGAMEFGRVNVLIGGNNSGKTAVLESLFLAPNPVRRVPYGARAVEVLHQMHQTLESQGYAFLLHQYSENASIEVSDESKRVITELSLKGEEIEVLMRDGKKVYLLGYLSKNSNSLHSAEIRIPPSLLMRKTTPPIEIKERIIKDVVIEVDKEGGYKSTGIPFDIFVSDLLGESLYFHPSLIKNAWMYFRSNWINYRASGLTVKVAEKISEGVGGEYDDLLLEPFFGQQAIYIRRKDGRGVRLGDLGHGAQVFATLLLLYESVKPRILLVDDIESHMNPALLSCVASWFMDVLENTMLFISTHSIEAAKLIAGALEDYEPRIKLLDLSNGILKSRDFSLEELEGFEKAGIDVRLGKGVLI
ncbi:MAG: AAA family ATPase [Archaeoglobaceae archaeon]